MFPFPAVAAAASGPVHCEDCDLPLRDPLSRRERRGPVCRGWRTHPAIRLPAPRCAPQDGPDLLDLLDDADQFDPPTQPADLEEHP